MIREARKCLFVPPLVALALVLLAGPSSAAASDWSVVPTPNVRAHNGQLFSESCTAASNCVAVGVLVKRSGIGVTLAERWNGDHWSVERTRDHSRARGSVLNWVDCASRSSCQAVGWYFTAAGIKRSLAERWNGRNWKIERTPRARKPEPRRLFGVSCASADACTAVGRSGSEALIERWNGKAWRKQRSRDPKGAQFSELVTDACPAASACTAVGDYIDANGNFVSLAERWNGRRWRSQRIPNPQGASFSFLDGAACPARRLCEATGGSDAGLIAERWNGKRWHLQPTPNPAGSQGDFLGGVDCTSPSACTTVGGYVNKFGAFVPMAERWNGTGWRVQRTPNPATNDAGFLNDVACPRRHVCRAVGVANGDGTPRALAERWHGRRWRLQKARNPTGAAENQLSGVACPKPSTCFAVGAAGPTLGIGTTEVERWDGSHWTLMPSPNPPGVQFAGFGSIACTSTSFCMAVGGTDSGPLAASWDGTKWTIEPTPNPAGAQFAGFGGVACTAPDACMAAGAYGDSSGNVLSLAEQWDGSSWTIVPTPNPTGAVQTFLGGISCTSDSACTTVGEKHSSTDVIHTIAERWDGSNWNIQHTPNPAGVRFASLGGVACAGPVACLAVGGSDLGTLAEVWDGSTWSIEPTPDPAYGGPNTGVGFTAVACPAGSTCSAVGFGFVDNGGVILAERARGTDWHIQRSPLLPGAGDISPPAVACPSLSTCMMVSGYENNGPGSITLAERWNRGAIGASTAAERPAPSPAPGPSCSAQDVSERLARAAAGRSAPAPPWFQRPGAGSPRVIGSALTATLPWCR